MKIAIVGSGIAGNVAAYRLHREHEITVFEAGDHVGGHTHTHDDRTRRATRRRGHRVHRVQRPHLPELHGAARRARRRSPGERDELLRAEPRAGLEYNGTTLNSLFAQRRNLVRPAFWRMIGDILRFNREAPRLLERPDDPVSIGAYLQEHGYSPQFVDHYILPMGAAIWSAGTAALRNFPAVYFVRFFHHHGMLSVDDRPQWLSIRGGSARYVERLTAQVRARIRLRTPVEAVRRIPAGVLVKAAGRRVGTIRSRLFRLSQRPGIAPADRRHPCRTRSAGRYPLSAQRRAAAHGYQCAAAPQARLGRVELPPARCTFGAGRRHVQHESPAASPDHTPLLVSLNMNDRIHPARVIRQLAYEHPVFTPEAVAAQSRQAEINGVNRAYFCGAYWRFGFHEDGVVERAGCARSLPPDRTCTARSTPDGLVTGASRRARISSAIGCS